MCRFYDALDHRLVYIRQLATPDFWDKHWDTLDLACALRQPNRMVVRMTRRYLPKGTRILEGGCGLGDKVWALREAGYEAHGVDFAKETVAKILAADPSLMVQEADVRRLPFPDAYFDGYWSLGVIEHFEAGYQEILSEMCRVLRPGGYVFLTAPAMSPLRRLKARLGAYPVWQSASAEQTACFYQYALDVKSIIDHFHQAGFTRVHYQGHSGLKGLKDEGGRIKPPLQRLSDARGPVAAVVKKCLDVLLCPWAYHAALLVLRKND